MSDPKWLPDVTINRLHQALVQARLARSTSLDALSETLDPTFAGSLPDAGAPTVRLLSTLHRLNEVRNLRSGEVPFAQWLDGAVTLVGPRVEADPIREALRAISNSDTEVPAALPATVGDPTFSAKVDEAAIGLDDTLDVAFLLHGAAVARSVARILVPRHFEGEPQFLTGNDPWLARGTGWLVAPGLLLTNYHVVNARSRLGGFVEPDATPEDLQLQAAQSEVMFDYFVEPSTASRVVPGPHQLLAFDRDLDFALLRIGDQSRPALGLGRNRLTKRVDQPLGIRVNVVQHPNGRPMRVAFRDNFVVLGSEEFLSYLTDTEAGASGSPVCDDAWSVVALHRGSRPIESALEFRGKRIDTENYGTPIRTIMDRLKRDKPEFHQEIEHHQSEMTARRQ